MNKHVCNHTIHDHQCHFGWNRDNPPVVRIAPGETVEFHPVDSSGGIFSVAHIRLRRAKFLVPDQRAPEEIKIPGLPQRADARLPDRLRAAHLHRDAGHRAD